MDGNGRWAANRGRPRTLGHRAGARAVREIVEQAARSNVDVLTLYAFSADNWRRPEEEVRCLLDLFHQYLLSESRKCQKNGVRLNVIGRRDRLDPTLTQAIQTVEAATKHGDKLLLRLAVDYSAQWALTAAAIRMSVMQTAADHLFREALEAVTNCAAPVADVDLLIRTGGERRLSDFLLFECAYAELRFVDRFWPDYDAEEFNKALKWFASRQRRFGACSGPHRSGAYAATRGEAAGDMR